MATGLSRATLASADTVLNGCSIVSNPTSTFFTNCPNWNSEGNSLAGFNLSYANFYGSVFADCSGMSIGPVTCVSSDLSHADLTIANPPTTRIGVPANGATVTGIQWLDASASPDVTKEVYEITGGSLTHDVIATGTPTIVGWLSAFDFSTVPNGTYTLQSVATAGGLSGTSAGITITVSH